MSKRQPSMPSTLTTIDPSALSAASGGRRAASASTSRASDDRILDALRDVTSALKDLGNKTATSSTNNNDNSTMLLTTLISRMFDSQSSGCGRRR
ncbi:MAG: hypothetical protein R3B48_05155 [Kofleriaceae bacterium]